MIENASAWEAQLARAREDDVHREDQSRSSVPPITAALVAAAMNSSLRRLYPFTSHNLLRFSRSPAVDVRHRDGIAPAFVAVVSDPDRYVVFSGAIGADPLSAVLETSDAAAAVEEVERLLSDWDWSVRMSRLA